MDDHDDFVLTVLKGRVRDEFPVTVFIDLGFTNHFTTLFVDDDDGVARLAFALEAGGIVVGGAAVLDRTVAAANFVQARAFAISARLAGRSDVDGDVPGRRGLGDLAGLADGACGEAMRAFTQGLSWGEGPLATGVGKGFPEPRTFVEDLDTSVRFGRAGEGGLLVVSLRVVADRALLVADIVEHLQDYRRRDGRGVDGELVRSRGKTSITGVIDCLSGDAVLAVGPGEERRKRPFTIGVGERSANQRLAVVDGNHAVGFGFTFDERRVVCGMAILGNFDRRTSQVVTDLFDDHSRGSNGIEDQYEVIGSVAATFDSSGKDVTTLLKRLFWLEAPVPVFANSYFANEL